MRITYLTCYNLLFATLWASVFIRTVSVASQTKSKLFVVTEPPVRWIQTASLLEVFHAAFGIIKSPVGTTFTQIVTRVIQVWLIWHTFPESTSVSIAYPMLLLAWSLADAIRYLYLALHLHARAPQILVWMRYTMFFILYPIGIGAEWWLFYLAVGPARQLSPILPLIFYFLLALYVPGAYTMYMYMVKQRRKVLGRKTKSG
ncbi:PTPLA-domain-containing protein [Periconia macrospinosa]|uniref:Very-long-chain (3R)-3-hydroxyacyl-CoA dehydratase n=1 Tax=Periconia macrospinosa TaxID=97972 RepID=A0A2V1DYX2_9PLEO|nr:PTPLA-domain-containing protein [Periconia macrospinosa]